MDAVLIDTCVLLKSYLHDTLLSIAEESTFRPVWSDHILAELRRNLLKVGAKQDAVERRIEMMTLYFPDARVTGYENLIDSMTNHPKDRHVLAAAVAGRADTLVTENVRDFPTEAVSHFGITVTSQDDFLLGLLELHPDAVLDALRRQASRYHREPRTLTALLDVLAGPGQGCPEFATQCRTLLLATAPAVPLAERQAGHPTPAPVSQPFGPGGQTWGLQDRRHVSDFGSGAGADGCRQILRDGVQIRP